MVARSRGELASGTAELSEIVTAQSLVEPEEERRSTRKQSDHLRIGCEWVNDFQLRDGSAKGSAGDASRSAAAIVVVEDTRFEVEKLHSMPA
jgi:hypothetical protein